MVNHLKLTIIKKLTYPMKKLDGSLVLSDVVKANLLGKHLSNIFIIFIPHRISS